MSRDSASKIIDNLSVLADQSPISFQITGKLTKIIGLAIEATGCKAPIGARFKILSETGASSEAEVVGFDSKKTFLLPLSYSRGILPGSKLIPVKKSGTIGVCNELLGRVVNASNLPIDDKGTIKFTEEYPLNGVPISPLKRASVSEPLDVGIKVINALLTIGKGQRIGLFAGTGVGKTVLMSMITKAVQADVVVIALVGERGREVEDFVSKTLGAEALKKSVVVVAPADDPPLMRLQGAMTATTIAEFFRDQGKDVLLIMDSLTRFAQAQREVGLSIGEPPANSGYPPSVFAKIPCLLERAGHLKNGGSITGIYTVLTEGDDFNDPISDASRGVLDGHILLDRALAEKGQYPAISVLRSVSRVMSDIIDDQHKKSANMFKKIYSCYIQNEDLIMMGAYKSGTNSEIDFAIEKYGVFEELIRQDSSSVVNFHMSKAKLFSAVS